MTEHRVIEADGVADLEAIGRIEGDALVTLLELNLAEHLDGLARRVLRLHAGVLNQVDPRRRAAVHDWHFAVVELDTHVVDAHAAERRQQMLDGLDAGVAGGQPGLQLLPAAEVVHVRGNLDAAQVGATETNAEVRRGGNQGERDLLTRMKTNPGTIDSSTKGTLKRHLVTPPR